MNDTSLAVIVDPHDYNQDDAILRTCHLVRAFCKENAIDMPGIEADNCRGYHGIYLSGSRVIKYDPRKCRVPVKTPGYSWSFTGYKADLTAPGVIAHELGHHVHFETPNAREVIRDWRWVTEGEPVTTSYGRTKTSEDIAESFKLFLLNPDLLEQGRPMRFNFFTDTLNLKPMITETWDDVLVYAHERLIEATLNWIAEGHQ